MNNYLCPQVRCKFPLSLEVNFLLRTHLKRKLTQYGSAIQRQPIYEKAMYHDVSRIIFFRTISSDVDTAIVERQQSHWRKFYPYSILSSKPATRKALETQIFPFYLA